MLLGERSDVTSRPPSKQPVRFGVIGVDHNDINGMTDRDKEVSGV